MRRFSGAAGVAVLVAVFLASVSVLLPPGTAHATHAENVSITASSTTIGATNVSYTVEFSIGDGNGATVPGQGDVVVTFPAGYDVSSATFVEAESTVGGAPIPGEYASFTVNGQALHLEDFTQLLSDGTRFVLKFEGIGNPAAPGNYSLHFQVFSHTIGDLASINTSGSSDVLITGPGLDAFQVTAVGGGPIAHQQVGVPFEVQIAALDDLGDPYTALDDAAYAVDITILGDTTGSIGLGALTLDFSSTPGTTTHTVTLAAAQAAEAITVTSTGAPAVNGTSNNFDVITPPPLEIGDVIIEAGEIPVPVVNRRSFPLGTDGAATGETTTANGTTLRVVVPAGAIDDATGLRLEVAAVQDQSSLDRQAASIGGADAFASFVIRLVDSRGVPVEAAFALPVTLTFTVSAQDLPDDVGEDMLLSFWDGSSWTLVPASVTLNTVGSATLVADLMHFTLFQVTGLPGDWGTFSPAPHATGISLTMWQGGGLDLLDAALDGAAAWVALEGQWYGYRSHAPAFVNAAFLENYADGVPRSTFVAFVR